MDSFQPEEFAELVRRFEIRSTVLPPGAMAMLSDDDAVTDLGPLRYVRSITAPLSPLQARRFTSKFGASVLNSYGQAEIGEVIGWTATDAKEHPEKVGAIGRPHLGVDLKVVDEAGTLLGADEIGTLFVRPPNMAAGYATGEELRDRVDADGYVNTGDLAASTPTASCGSRDEPATSSTAAATRSFPNRSKRCSASRPASRMRRWSECPTTGSAKYRWPSW